MIVQVFLEIYNCDTGNFNTSLNGFTRYCLQFTQSKRLLILGVRTR
jgi:hypothetical protein